MQSSRSTRAVRASGETLALAIVLLYFAARLVVLATALSPDLPPDEIDHAGLSLHHQAYWSWAEDTSDSYRYGVIGDRPALFYWVMGRWLSLRPPPIPPLVWLRLGNGALALGTVLAGLAWMRSLGGTAATPIARVLFAVVLTNLPMWSFLSASVNYDNLAALCGMLAFLALARTLATHEPAALLALVAILCAGALTKLAFLPVAALLPAALPLAIRRAGGGGLREIFEKARPPTPRVLAAGLAVLVLGGLAGELYAGNLLRYGTLSPAPNQVLALADAKRNRIFLQEYVLRSYRSGAIGYREAVGELRAIEHDGDRAGALWMLSRAREMRDDAGPALLGRAAYAPVWLELMAERIFGVMGHRALYKSGVFAAAYAAIAIAGLLALAVRALGKGPEPERSQLRITAAVGTLYALILMQAVNYPIYRTTGLELEAVQGRYFFPVIAAWVGASIAAGLSLLPRRARVPVAIGVALFFVAGDAPYFWSNADAAWFAQAGSR